MLIGLVRNNEISNIVNITSYDKYVINGNFEIDFYTENNKIIASNYYNKILVDDIILIPDKIWIECNRDYNTIIKDKKLYKELKQYYSVGNKLLQGIIYFGDLI